MENKKIVELYKKDPSYYGLARGEMIAYLPKNVKKVLDVGCGNGSFLTLVKKTIECEAWGIDIHKDSIDKAKSSIDKAFCGNVDEIIGEIPDRFFDAIYFNDVLEHMVDPYTLLKRISEKLTPQGVVIASIPNVRYFKNLRKLVFEGTWDYTDDGILDRTHLRFFTKISIEKTFIENGYDIVKIEGLHPSPSAKPRLYNLFTLGMIGTDIKYRQFAVVAKPNNKK